MIVYKAIEDEDSYNKNCNSEFLHHIFYPFKILLSAYNLIFTMRYLAQWQLIVRWLISSPSHCSLSLRQYKLLFPRETNQKLASFPNTETAQTLRCESLNETKQHIRIQKHQQAVPFSPSFLACVSNLWAFPFPAVLQQPSYDIIVAFAFPTH